MIMKFTDESILLIRELKRQILFARGWGAIQEVQKQIDELESALFKKESFYIESIASDGVENYILADKDRYVAYDSKIMLEKRKKN